MSKSLTIEDQPPAPPLLRGQGVGLKFQLTNHMVGSPGKQSPNLGAFPKSPHKQKLRWGTKGFVMNKQDTSITFITWEIPRVLGALSEMGQRWFMDHYVAIPI